MILRNGRSPGEPISKNAKIGEEIERNVNMGSSVCNGNLVIEQAMSSKEIVFTKLLSRPLDFISIGLL